MSSTAVLADITPEQAWEGLQKQYNGYGFTITAGEVERDGDVLTVSDAVFTTSSETTVGETKVVSKNTLTVPGLLFEDLGDGTVQVSVDGEITGTNVSTTANGKTETAKIRIDKTEASAVISGTAEEITYDIDAPTATIEITAEPPAPNSPPPVVTLTVTELTGTQKISSAGGQSQDIDLQATGIKVNATGADPEAGSTVKTQIDLSDTTIKGKGKVPEGADMSDLSDALAKGLRSDSEVSYGAMSYSLDVDQKDGPISISGTAQSGHALISLSRDAVRYNTTGSNTTFEVQTAQFPQPMTASVDQGEVDMAFPLATTPEPQPFTAKIGLMGLSLSEQIWKSLDPTAKLGHGPATLIVDLTGKGRTLVDLFSAAAAASPVPPVEIESLNVNRVQLTAAGAELTGNGALTFDNSMGMPMPLGAIDLKLAGANKLMDALVAMGVAPQDQVMFGKMMLGLYAVPAGDDLFTSKVEFKAGGQILANGQPIK